MPQSLEVQHGWAVQQAMQAASNRFTASPLDDPGAGLHAATLFDNACPCFSSLATHSCVTTKICP